MYLRPPKLARAVCALLLIVANTVDFRVARAQQPASDPLVQRVQGDTQRMEMTANSSRIVTMDQKIVRAQVNNREVLELTALSPTEIQVFAKKTGVTQINLWNDQNKVHTIDVIVYGDARELQMILAQTFPTASIRVVPTGTSALLVGRVDKPDDVQQIVAVAGAYYPQVINNITVGGVQQILLKVKVAEVSRSRLRKLGVDWQAIAGGGSYATSAAASVIGLFPGAGPVVSGAGPSGIFGTGNDTMRFGILNGNSQTNVFIEALRKYDLIKIMAEPNLVTTSGRPAFFNSGGEFPITVPQSLGTVSIEYKKYGTQVDFVPIVLGNGNIRLEVRPRVSEIDPTRSVVIQGINVPALRVREVDTGVEMKAGQTLALAGLIQSRKESQNTGLPWFADVPYLGAAFRKVKDQTEEVELLITVTPYLIDPLDCPEVPPCMPGMHTDDPNDCELYWKGYLEVPSRGPCGPGWNGQGGCGPNGCGPHGCNNGPMGPGGPEGQMIGPMGPTDGQMGPQVESVPVPGESAKRSPTGPRSAARPSAAVRGATGVNSSPPAQRVSPASPSRVDDRYNRTNVQQPRAPVQEAAPSGPPSLIGPVGYDVVN